MNLRTVDSTEPVKKFKKRVMKRFKELTNDLSVFSISASATVESPVTHALMQASFGASSQIAQPE